MQTAFADAWRARKPGWKERVLRRFVETKVAVMQDVVENGLRDPLLVQRGTMKLSDGGHRLAVLKAQGHTSAIVRLV